MGNHPNQYILNTKNKQASKQNKMKPKNCLKLKPKKAKQTKPISNVGEAVGKWALVNWYNLSKKQFGNIFQKPNKY